MSNCDDMEICEVKPEFAKTPNCLMKKMLGKCPKEVES